ncbi:Gp138 family membrane-puncturing spike protein [Psychrobacter sp. AOP7-A1-24]|uniref:Gp138 family membrane-puncturing spike protein n=1 Tax=Psychrobacter sp. AOP7-A1-24 TaxID=3457646 RepID=UPI00402B4693
MINNKAREIAASEFSDRQAQISSALMDVHTSMPAIIMSYDANTRTITAQPAIQRVFSDGEGISGPMNLPPCVDVPVIFPGGGSYEITFPINEGDECLLIFSERCIDSWFVSGEPNVPADYRQHDLSDAIAIVGLKSLAKATPTDNAGMNIGSATNKIAITDDDVSITVNGSNHINITDGDISITVNDSNHIAITEDFIDLSLNTKAGASKFTVAQDSISADINGAILSLSKDGLNTNMPIRCPNIITDEIDVNEHTHSGVEVGAGDTMKPKRG